MVAIQREYSMGIWLTQPDDFSGTVGSIQRLQRTTENAVLRVDEGWETCLFREEVGAEYLANGWDGTNPKPLTKDYRFGKLLPYFR
jgi:hypothetical protein